MLDFLILSFSIWLEVLWKINGRSRWFWFNFKCKRQIEIQFQVLKKKRVSKCVRDTDDTRIKVSKLVMGLFFSDAQARRHAHPPSPLVASHCLANLLDSPSLAWSRDQRRGLITTGEKSGSLTFNLYLFIQEAYRPNFGCHILVKSQFFREKYRKSMLLEPWSWTLSAYKKLPPRPRYWFSGCFNSGWKNILIHCSIKV